MPYSSVLGSGPNQALNWDDEEASVRPKKRRKKADPREAGMDSPEVHPDVREGGAHYAVGNWDQGNKETAADRYGRILNTVKGWF